MIGCRICGGERVSLYFCAKHANEWHQSPERMRVARIYGTADKRVDVAVMDFATRVRAEAA